MIKSKRRVGIVGVGNVGAPLAYLLMSKGYIVFIEDVNEAKVTGELMDLEEASIMLGMHKPYRLEEGDEVDILIICAGYPRKKDESDLRMHRMNSPIVASILKKYDTDKIYIITNPPHELTMEVKRIRPNSEVKPIGDVVDKTRFGLGRKTSQHILWRKGYTNWGVITEMIKEIDNDKTS